MQTGQENCPRCGDANPLDGLVCVGCGSRLPWADAATAARRQQQADLAAQQELDRQAQVAAQATAQREQLAAQQAAIDAHNAQLATLPRRGERRIPGKCPSCGEEQLVEFKRKGRDDGSMQACACCLGCWFFFLPLLLMLPFLAKRGDITHLRRCLKCNHQWQV